MDRQNETRAKPPGSDFDAELDAIRAVFAALEPLNREARDRVVSFAFRRLGISVAAEPELVSLGAAQITGGSPFSGRRTPAVMDIAASRRKQPSSAREMAFGSAAIIRSGPSRRTQDGGHRRGHQAVLQAGRLSGCPGTPI